MINNLAKQQKVTLPQEKSNPESVKPEDVAGDVLQVEERKTEKNIAEWQAILSNLNKKEKRAALIAIEKLKGSTHLEAYRAVMGDSASKDSARVYVSKQRNIALEIATKFKLYMPPWSDSENTNPD